MNAPLVPSLLVVTLLGPALAQAAPPGAERADLRKSRHQLRDDKQDRRRLAAIVADWKSAVANRNAQGERAADRKLEAWLVSELGEERKESKQASRETRRSRRELRSTRGRRAASPAARDDRRDLADDQRDQAAQKAEQGSLKALALKLRALQPRFRSRTASPADYAEKSRILDALLVAESREVGRGRMERGEDRRERREVR